MKINIKKNILSKEEKEFFKKMNPGFSITGDTIKICLEYYEVALAYMVVRISKDTLEIM